jgi:uncharacterized protein GlcG (DUF336 family)
MKKVLISAFCSLFLITTVYGEDEVSLVTTKRMTLPTALKVAQAAIDHCTQLGIQIGVTVVDREGIVQVTLRDTIAAQITVPISHRKAYTAANFNSATSALGERANSPVGRAPMILMSAGAVPIVVSGALVGAVGVSGAPAGETDEECAKAGVDAVLDDLEMSM